LAPEPPALLKYPPTYTHGLSSAIANTVPFKPLAIPYQSYPSKYVRPERGDGSGTAAPIVEFPSTVESPLSWIGN